MGENMVVHFICSMYWTEFISGDEIFRFFLVVFGIIDHGVFAVLDTIVFPVILAAFIVFVAGGAIFCWG